MIETISSAKKIKYIFYFLISFFFVFHFVLPGSIFLIKGYQSTYTSDYFDLFSLLKGVGLNILSLILGALLISLTKWDYQVKEIQYNSKLYLLLAIIFTIGSSWTIGKYSNALNTLHAPTGFFIFYGMFFSLELYFVFALISSQEFLASAQFLYLFKGLAVASRSVSLVLFLFFVYSSWSKNIFKFIKRYFIYLIIVLVLSLFSFNWARQVRSYGDKPIESKIRSSLTVSRSLFDQIVGRMSFLETTMLPIIFKDKNLKGLDVFYEKYSMANQSKLVLNNILPIKFFKFDVYPDQYYRSAFLNLPVERAREYYTSINMTLPVYFYMYFNFVVAILITGFLIWGYYLLTVVAFRFHLLAGAILISNFYGSFLYYFDWVMVVKPLVVGMLAAIGFVVASKIQDSIVKLCLIIKKRLSS